MMKKIVSFIFAMAYASSLVFAVPNDTVIADAQANIITAGEKTSFVKKHKTALWVIAGAALATGCVFGGAWVKRSFDKKEKIAKVFQHVTDLKKAFDELTPEEMRKLALEEKDLGENEMKFLQQIESIGKECEFLDLETKKEVLRRMDALDKKIVAIEFEEKAIQEAISLRCCPRNNEIDFSIKLETFCKKYPEFLAKYPDYFENDWAQNVRTYPNLCSQELALHREKITSEQAALTKTLENLVNERNRALSAGENTDKLFAKIKKTKAQVAMCKKLAELDPKYSIGRLAEFAQPILELRMERKTLNDKQRKVIDYVVSCRFDDGFDSKLKRISDERAKKVIQMMLHTSSGLYPHEERLLEKMADEISDM